MHSTASVAREHDRLSRPALRYFALAFGLSWAGALLVVAPHLLRGEALPKFAGLMMFPVMLIGPAAAGIAMTWKTGGTPGMRGLLQRMLKASVAPRWYAVLLLPPALVLAVLTILSRAFSPAFAPSRFFPGIAFGLIAGFVEEIGWTGFAFPAMSRSRKPLVAAALLGVLWGLWHIPVVDYLGAATPHGHYWLPYLLAFITAMTAVRVLICWVFVNTQSVLLAQLLHASSTGALVVFSPRVNAGQETLWYFFYAFALWLVVAAVVAGSGTTLKRN